MDSVFQPKTITVSLAGLSFDWTEAPRRRNRELMRDMLPISEFDQNKPEEMLAAVDAILDFFYKNHEGMRAARETIDDTATETEIAEAFKLVSELIVGPFAMANKEAQSS